MKPMLAARQAASSPSERPSMRWSATAISPASARSMPPSRLSSVVLPEPDGPMTAMKSPRGIARSRWSKIEIVSLPLVKRLLTPARRTIGCSAATVLSCWNSLIRRGFVGRPRRAGTRVAQEHDLDRHVRQNARILLLEPDAHAHRGLFPVGGGDDRDHRSRDGPIWVSIEHGVDRAACHDATDEGLVDVDFDLDRIHVDNGADARAGEAAAGGQRGNHFTRLRAA